MIAPQNHTRKAEASDSWITPEWLLKALGPFDLDPCASTPQPWPTARRMINEAEDGLMCKWEGFVWLNPPYGRALGVWLNRLALHGNGIALVFARTETKPFHRYVWPFSELLLFLEGRLTFFRPDGKPDASGGNAGGPSVLIGYGDEAARRLRANRKLGALVAPL